MKIPNVRPNPISRDAYQVSYNDDKKAKGRSGSRVLTTENHEDKYPEEVDLEKEHVNWIWI